MKKLFLLLIMIIPLALHADGIYLRGMKGGQLLKTEYDPVSKTHTLATSAAAGYEDRVLLFSFMTENNDSVTIDANKDYSDAGLGRTAFVIKPKPGEVYRLSRLIVSYKDNGSFDSGTYGNGLVLTNGIAAWFRKDGDDTCIQATFHGID